MSVVHCGSASGRTLHQNKYGKTHRWRAVVACLKTMIYEVPLSLGVAISDSNLDGLLPVPGMKVSRTSQREFDLIRV